MQINHRPLTRHDIEFKTSINRQLMENNIERAQQADNDVSKTERLLDQLCRYCYYLAGQMAGAAMTHTTCGLCRKEMLFGSTNVDRLCLECAKTNSLCKHCGADLALNTRRRKFPVLTEVP